MDKNLILWEKAKQIAARRYFTIVNREETENGDYYYVAFNPDLPGCIADGKTSEKAKQELAEARIDFVYFLLEDNIIVPEPKTYEIKVTPLQTEEYTSLSEREQLIPYSGYVIEAPASV